MLPIIFFSEKPAELVFYIPFCELLFAMGARKKSSHRAAWAHRFRAAWRTGRVALCRPEPARLLLTSAYSGAAASGAPRDEPLAFSSRKH